MQRRTVIAPTCLVITLATCLVLVCHSHAKAQQTFRHPRPQSAMDVRLDYPLALVRAALKRSAPEYGPTELEPAAAAMPCERMAAMLTAGAPGLDFMVHHASPDLEDHLTPVRVPLENGLSEWRVLLVRANIVHNIPHSGALQTVQHATRQGVINCINLDMETVPGFRRVALPTYEAQFIALAQGRVDMLARPLGVGLLEYMLRRDDFPELRVADILWRTAPAPLYVWPANSPRGDALRKRLETGLAAMHADGSFEAIFRAHFDPILQELSLPGNTEIVTHGWWSSSTPETHDAPQSHTHQERGAMRN